MAHTGQHGFHHPVEAPDFNSTGIPILLKALSLPTITRSVRTPPFTVILAAPDIICRTSGLISAEGKIATSCYDRFRCHC